MSLLEVKDLCRTFRQGDTDIHAVDHVSFSMEEGEMLAIVGQSGSGKTTLLNLLGGIDKPTAGQVLLEGQDIHHLSDGESAKLRRRKIGYIYQDFKLLPILTARENILSPLLIGKRPINDKYFKELCGTLGITHRLEHLPSEMSGGECQRVAVARAMIGQPDVLFADEPTGNLDKKSAGELISLLKQAHEQFGQTILMVTHDESLLSYGDRVYRMENGTPTLV